MDCITDPDHRPGEIRQARIGSGRGIAPMISSILPDMRSTASGGWMPTAFTVQSFLLCRYLSPGTSKRTGICNPGPNILCRDHRIRHGTQPCGRDGISHWVLFHEDDLRACPRKLARIKHDSGCEVPMIFDESASVSSSKRSSEKPGRLLERPGRLLESLSTILQSSPNKLKTFAWAKLLPLPWRRSLGDLASAQRNVRQTNEGGQAKRCLPTVMA